MKTAITVLQEMMIKVGVVPEYEYLAQTGPQHQSTFEYRCAAKGEQVTAIARSKKEAKQEAARLLLLKLAAKGHDVPPPFNIETQAPTGKHKALSPKRRRLNPPSNESKNGPASDGGASVAAQQPAVDSRSYVALLKELCEEYRLPAVDYDLVADTGPPHLRHFTMRARMGQHERMATATNKRAAKQASAEKLYLYLRENLRVTRDFVEEAALVRAHEKAMDRYRETRAEVLARPRLEQRVADYQHGLRDAHDAEQISLAQAAVREQEPPEVALGCAMGALQLQAEWTTLGTGAGPGLQVVNLVPTSPALAFAGDTREQAAAAALKYIRAALPLTTPDHPTNPLNSNTIGVI